MIFPTWSLVTRARSAPSRSPRSVADLYRGRWQIEVFFKQTLQFADFPGHNANAVRWQVWIALLVYELLCYLGNVSRWAHTTRLGLGFVLDRYWRRRPAHMMNPSPAEARRPCRPELNF